MLTPVKAIRAKCLDCSGFQPSEVRRCESEDCPLFPYRLGKNPNRVGIKKLGYSDEKEPTQLKITTQTGLV
ncbi:MAG: hypothetical protein ABSE81_06295 [Candidatus Omnitrophota bacterium]|jgi:hypothetical protein